MVLVLYLPVVLGLGVFYVSATIHGVYANVTTSTLMKFDVSHVTRCPRLSPRFSLVWGWSLGTRLSNSCRWVIITLPILECTGTVYCSTAPVNHQRLCFVSTHKEECAQWDRGDTNPDMKDRLKNMESAILVISKPNNAAKPGAKAAIVPSWETSHKLNACGYMYMYLRCMMRAACAEGTTWK